MRALDLQDSQRNLTAEGQEFGQLWGHDGQVTLKLSPLENQGSSAPLKVPDTPSDSRPPTLTVAAHKAFSHCTAEPKHLTPTFSLFLALLSPSGTQNSHFWFTSISQSRPSQMRGPFFDVSLVTVKNNHCTGPYQHAVQGYISKISSQWAPFQ